MNGKKTYIIALLMVVHAASAYFLGKDQNLDLKEILTAAGMAGLRHGVGKAGVTALIALFPVCLMAAPISTRDATPLQATDPGAMEHSVGQAQGHPSPAPLPPEEMRLFRAGEISIDSFASMRTSDLQFPNGRWGTGVGLSYFPLRGAGIRGELSTENTQGATFDATGATLLGRLASEKLHVALEYGLGFNFHFDGNQWIPEDSFTIHAEIGPRLRITPNWDIWGKVRGVRRATSSEKEHLEFLVGTSIAFGGK